MFRFERAILIASVLVLLAVPIRPAAAQVPPGYTLIDLGTFGGPQAFVGGQAQVLNNRGMIGGWADTTVPDPNYPNFNPFILPAADPHITHAFLWHNGVQTDLGALTGGSSSTVANVNAEGDAAGTSGNGTIDPLTGYPAGIAALWKDGSIINLGTLGGNDSVGG